MKVAVITMKDKDYYFLLHNPENYIVGDYVITTGKCKDVVKIKDIVDFEEAVKHVDNPIFREVIGRVDNYDKYLKRKFAAEQIVNLSTKIDKKVQEARQQITAEVLAVTDDEVKDMVNAIKTYESIIEGGE